MSLRNLFFILFVFNNMTTKFQIPKWSLNDSYKNYKAFLYGQHCKQFIRDNYNSTYVRLLIDECTNVNDLTHKNYLTEFYDYLILTCDPRKYMNFFRKIQFNNLMKKVLLPDFYKHFTEILNRITQHGQCAMVIDLNNNQVYYTNIK